MTSESQQAQDMPATMVREKAETLTRALCSGTDAYMVKLTQTEAMNREAPAADRARDLAERIERRFFSRGYTEHPNAVLVGGTDQADQTLGGTAVNHAAIISRALAPPSTLRQQVRSEHAAPASVGTCWRGVLLLHESEQLASVACRVLRD